VRTRQAAYIRRVVDALNDLDNALFEVTNEGGNGNWDRFVLDRVHAYERTSPKQHPIGLTGHGSVSNDAMRASPADWYSPVSSDWPDLKADPRVADGRKVSLLDTDHVFGVGGDPKWVWKAFLRGHNELFMDPYGDPAWAPILASQGVGVRDAEAARRAMGLTRRYAGRIDLAASGPAPELASTGDCLACPAGSTWRTCPTAAGWSWTSPGRGGTSPSSGRTRSPVRSRPAAPWGTGSGGP
jgi:hypothetical protein